MTDIINWQPDFLANEIVALVPLSDGDFDILYSVASDPLVWEQHPSSDRYKPEVFRLFFDVAIQSGTAFLIVLPDTKTVIGSTRFYDYKPDQSVAVGYTFLAREYWGGRYNHAVKKLMLNYAFQFVDNVRLQVGAQNMRSQKAVQRIGGIKIAEMTIDHYGKPVAHFEYNIAKEQWLLLDL